MDNQTKETASIAARSKTAQLVLTAMFAAIICVATLIIRIPSPLGGYSNLGDTVVLLAAFLLGPSLGAAAAGIGSMLADIASGYAIYAIPTLLIKSLMAIVAALLFRALTKGKSSTSARVTAAVVAGLAAETIMVAGYYFFALLFLAYEGSAALTIPGNAIQGLVGITGALALLIALPRSFLGGE